MVIQMAKNVEKEIMSYLDGLERKIMAEIDQIKKEYEPNLGEKLKKEDVARLRQQLVKVLAMMEKDMTKKIIDTIVTDVSKKEVRLPASTYVQTFMTINKKHKELRDKFVKFINKQRKALNVKKLSTSDLKYKDFFEMEKILFKVLLLVRFSYYLCGAITLLYLRETLKNLPTFYTVCEMALFVEDLTHDMISDAEDFTKAFFNEIYSHVKSVIDLKGISMDYKEVLFDENIVKKVLQYMKNDIDEERIDYIM